MEESADIEYPSPEDLADSLNKELTEWSHVYNALRGDPDFDLLTGFIWERAIDRIYRKLPQDFKLGLEVTERT